MTSVYGLPCGGGNGGGSSSGQAGLLKYYSPVRSPKITAEGTCNSRRKDHQTVPWSDPTMTKVHPRGAADCQKRGSTKADTSTHQSLCLQFFLFPLPAQVHGVTRQSTGKHCQQYPTHDLPLLLRRRQRSLGRTRSGALGLLFLRLARHKVETGQLSGSRGRRVGFRE